MTCLAIIARGFPWHLRVRLSQIQTENWDWRRSRDRNFEYETSRISWTYFYDRSQVELKHQCHGTLEADSAHSKMPGICLNARVSVSSLRCLFILSAFYIMQLGNFYYIAFLHDKKRRVELHRYFPDVFYPFFSPSMSLPWFYYVYFNIYLKSFLGSWI